MEIKKETKQFKTEIQQILNLIVNSIYSNKDIFVRELISNASDAIDKLRFKSEIDPNLLENDTEFKINIKIDKTQNTIEISDNGIGMTYDEVIENIGTIAKSDTANFAKAIKKAKDNKNLTSELIGQFGVGFYSTFMVSEKVTLITKSIESNNATKWISKGEGEFTIEKTEKKSRGTKIILNLKPKSEEDKDYTDQWVIQDIIKQHSDFVSYPILMDMEKYEPIPENEIIKDKNDKPIGETSKKITKEETLNSMKAIWTKPSNEISEKEYEEFYKHISHDWNPPIEKLHIKLEGTTEYYALLFVPSVAPFSLFNNNKNHGIRLYSKRIFIMDDCKELIPEYLRFVKGIVDAADLNLNISREILQQDNLIINIRKNLIKKLFNLFENMESEKYEKFYEEMGYVLKEGIHTDPSNKNQIASLIRYKTTKSNEKWVSLDNYITNMPPDQKEIFYITGENINTLTDSPHLEKLKEKNYEVLLMTDPVDEWVVQSITEYKEKPLKSAEKGDLNINEIDANKKKSYNSLFDFIKNHLENDIKEVKPSTHLKDSIACMSGDTWSSSAYMEKILKASGQKTQKNKRDLELNIDHPVIKKIKSLFENDKENPILKDYSELLLDIAMISEGSKLKNPSKFSKMIGSLMNKTI